MSRLRDIGRILPPHIRSHKSAPEPLVCLTAYSAPVARILDPLCDLLLVGDSLAMTCYGMDSTLPVSLDTMIMHGKAVASSSSHACIAVDMPFGSYQESREIAFRNSARVISETGCSAIKLEGGREMASTIGFLVDRGIPVIAHIGLKPQYFNALGGYKVQGRSDQEAENVLADARAVTGAGAFAVVLEGLVEPLARQITGEIAIPTIGIGASGACDGQILVTDDLLGLTGGPYPKFVRNYANLHEEIQKAVGAFAHDVRSGIFPGENQTYSGSSKK